MRTLRDLKVGDGITIVFGDFEGSQLSIGTVVDVGRSYFVVDDGTKTKWNFSGYQRGKRTKFGHVYVRRCEPNDENGLAKCKDVLAVRARCNTILRTDLFIKSSVSLRTLAHALETFMAENGI